MRIITLVENTRPPGAMLRDRFGLGFYIESGGKKILFDVGPDDAFVWNANALGVDLHKIDACVLSHAHYDHTAGLRDFFRVNTNAPVYLLAKAAGNYFSESRGPMRYIGISHTLLNEQEKRFQFFTGVKNIFENVHLQEVSCQKCEKPISNRLLYKKTEDGYLTDDFQHELVMTVVEENSMFIFTGCAHNGLRNMLQTVVTSFPEFTIKAIVGGFHLSQPGTGVMGESAENVTALGKYLSGLNIEKIITGHCTGEEAFELLKSELGDSLVKLQTGFEISF